MGRLSGVREEPLPEEYVVGCVLDPREFAIFQRGLAIFMMEEGFALQADGPPLGGILRMVRTGIGCEKGYWRRPPREPEA